MQKLDTHIQKYLTDVKHELKPYSFALKKKALQTLSDDLLSFIDDAPNADFEQICKHFGRPGEFAACLLDSIDKSELKKCVTKKRKLTLIVILSLVLLLILCTFSLSHILNVKVTHATENTVVYVNE